MMLEKNDENQMDNKITNVEVFERIGERKTLWESLRKRRGQRQRHGGLLRDFLEGMWHR